MNLRSGKILTSPFSKNQDENIVEMIGMNDNITPDINDDNHKEWLVNRIYGLIQDLTLIENSIDNFLERLRVISELYFVINENFDFMINSWVGIEVFIFVVWKKSIELFEYNTYVLDTYNKQRYFSQTDKRFIRGVIEDVKYVEKKCHHFIFS